ncbi:MAG: condensation domain-containing protein, partial [Actinomycetota bacterium]|nr:condensation domain-containing protein [Actinomycetota bacterium]
MSSAQRGLWFLDQLEEGTPVYNVSLAVRLRGPLDVLVLRAALAEINDRHEALRTRLTVVEGVPVQLVDQHHAVSVTVARPQGGDALRRVARAIATAESYARLPFDLAAGPLWRAVLVRVSEDDHLLVLVFHHAICDDASVRVILSELAQRYAGSVGGVSAPLAAPPLQYGDFAVWEAGRSDRPDRRAHLAYWTRQLQGLPDLALPTDRQRSPFVGWRGATVASDVDPATAVALRRLAASAGTTPFVTLLALFSVALARWSGQNDVVVGTPISLRDRRELESVVGLLVSTLPIRVNLAGAPTFREVLAQVGDVVLNAHNHRDTALENLMRELRPTRDLSRAPLFQVLFYLQPDPLDGVSFPGLAIESVELDHQTAKFDLTLSAVEHSDGLALRLEYRADLFDPATARRLLGHLHHLLEQEVADPDRAVGDLEVLTPAERHQLVVEANATEVPVPAVRVEELV